MTYQIVSRPRVKSDILNAIDYYKNISPDLAKRFLFRIREAKDYLSLYPFAFEIRYKNVRTLLLKQFPYHLHYMINDDQKQIIILAIIHAYKNPFDYSSRK